MAGTHRSAEAALARLKEGNSRFVSGVLSSAPLVSEERRNELVCGQRPWAVILSCSDSRVPPELVFDAGLGELFVVRVAGNLAGPLELGSIEFAVSQLGTQLIVVLGHTGCGAVAATVSALKGEPGGLTPHLRQIVEEIRTPVQPLLAEETQPDADVLDRAVQANVAHIIAELPRRSELLGRLVRDGSVRITGAVYRLETGGVEFLE